MVKWLFLDLNSYFASCEQQMNPQYRGKPLAVIPTDADTTACIAASYEAKKFGISTGTLVREAKQKCKDIILVPAHHALYVKFHHQIIDVVESCIPIHAVCSIDEMSCQLTGSWQKIENAIRIANKIKYQLKTQVGECLTCSIGLSSNSLLAKMASDMKKPDGLTIIKQSDLPKALHHLKLQDIPGVGARMHDRLNNQGVYSMEQLLALSEQQMRLVWGGVVGARYYHMLRGDHIELTTGETKSISHSHVLPPDVRSFLGAKSIAHKLIAKAAMRLRREKMMCKKMNIYIRYYNDLRWEQGLQFHETQDTGFFLQKFNEVYDHSYRTQKPIKVSIWLSDFRAETEHQLSFFANEKRNQAFKTMDALNEKFGKDTVYVGALQEHLQAAPTRIAFGKIPDLDEIE